MIGWMIARADRMLSLMAARVWREALDDYRRRHGALPYVYAIQAGGDDGPVKIGIAKSPCERLATLQQGSAVELRGLAAWPTIPEQEKWVHEDFAHARIRGEWFQPVPELLEFVLYQGGIFDDWTPLTKAERAEFGL